MTSLGSPSLGWKEVRKVWSHDLHSKNIYTVYSSLYIYAYIYIEKVVISFGEATKVWGVRRQELSQEDVVDSSAPPSPAALHILGRGLRGDRRGEGGLVSKLGCNLRKSPGSGGSGGNPPGVEGPSPGGEGRALGSSEPGTKAKDLPSHPPPCPGQAEV